MKTALLVIDLQKAIFDDHPFAERLVAKTVNRLIAAASIHDSIQKEPMRLAISSDSQR